MKEYLQLDLFQVIADITKPDGSAKDIAIKRAEQAQEARVNGWSDKGIVFLRQFLSFTPDFITEDFRLWAESNGLETPKETRCYGALLLRAKKAGLIHSTNEYRLMKADKSHSCPKMVWRLS